VHPPAGGNPIMVIVAGVSYEYLINPIILGSFIMLALAIVINKLVLKKNYPVR
jgi:CBS-domain-containing membrane protein